MRQWIVLATLTAAFSLCAGEPEGATITVTEEGKVKVEGVKPGNVNVETVVETVDANGNRIRRFGGGPITAGGFGGNRFGAAAFTNWRNGIEVNVSPRRMWADSFAHRFGDIIDADSRAKLEQLPYGADRRSVLNVPIGGIDNPGAQWNNRAINVEDYFTLTPEQTKAITTLRDEYKQAQDDLAKELFAQQREWANKLAALRNAYELRANDVLTGEDKKKKEELDAFMKDVNTKNLEIVTKLLDELKPDDGGRALYQQSNDKTLPNIEAAEKKLLELATAENRAKVEEILKGQIEQRERLKQWQARQNEQNQDGNNNNGDRRRFDRRERGERGERGENKNEAVPPPKAPEKADGF